MCQKITKQSGQKQNEESRKGDGDLQRAVGLWRSCQTFRVCVTDWHGRPSEEPGTRSVQARMKSTNTMVVPKGFSPINIPAACCVLFLLISIETARVFHSILFDLKHQAISTKYEVPPHVFLAIPTLTCISANPKIRFITISKCV